MEASKVESYRITEDHRIRDHLVTPEGEHDETSLSAREMLNLFSKTLGCYEEPRRHGLDVEFYPYANLKHTIRIRKERYLLRISDIMLGAPPDALAAIAHIMFCRITGRSCPRQFEKTYSHYSNSSGILQRMENVQRERGWKYLYGTQGKCRDLDKTFDRLNQEYFEGDLKKPDITWTRSRTRSTLGMYDDTFNIIAINRRLDARHVPRYVLDYIMYHEMLHIRHPIVVRNGRRMVHPRKFREDERKFRDHQRAKTWLRE